MNVLFLATALVACTAPFAVANAQTDIERRTQVRIESDSPSGGSSPTATRQTPATPAPAASQTTAQREAADAARLIAERRRSGKRIPDAELIGPRGAL
ncbi:hypothetical protein [Terricaulis sp.]|uniref:hypothetical protein n=1 Tax=Terricaulis sp. TaxID=2768686 RepID=UPI002AC63A74|nr:hypothetical protein [Terricaulis sp.]MDZ4693190.1 hypothetical protein [Terricaulis sp.]